MAAPSTSDASGGDAPADGMPRLELLKTLGDNTRYAIYLELARSPRPLATSEVAATLDLHANTVRPHLERMRELGLVEVTVTATGAVGRPQHRYALAPGAPSLGLEPPAFPSLARMLLAAAAAAGLEGDDLAAAGREQGRTDRESTAGGDVLADLEVQLAGLGFDPARVDEDGETTIAFAHCPFRPLAEQHPDLVCSLHRGMVEGFLECDPEVDIRAFHALVDRTPCQVDLVRVGECPSDDRVDTLEP